MANLGDLRLFSVTKIIKIVAIITMCSIIYINLYVYTLSFFYKKFFIRNFGKMNFKFKKFGLQFSQN